jgi:hypothetical protein
VDLTCCGGLCSHSCYVCVEVGGEILAGDTLSSRHVSSRDVTSRVGIFNIEFWGTLTLLSLCFVMSRLMQCVRPQKFTRRAGM